MLIDSETYWIKEINRYKTITHKTQIVLATSLRKDSHHILRLQHKEFGRTKSWNTYTVSRDGTVYQHYDPKNHADFLGIKEADKQSISIVMENMGTLYEMPNGNYVNWINETCDAANVVQKSWLGYNYWEKFTGEQLEATAELCRSLCDEFNIHKTMMDFNTFHKDTVKFKGVAFRSNYIEESADINPLFNICNFNEMLQ
jgi:N-acetyl-anhydromuramyl-L-alanine amidase AmpD